MNTSSLKCRQQPRSKLLCVCLYESRCVYVLDGFNLEPSQRSVKDKRLFIFSSWCVSLPLFIKLTKIIDVDAASGQKRNLTLRLHSRRGRKFSIYVFSKASSSPKIWYTVLSVQAPEIMVEWRHGEESINHHRSR